MKLMRRTHLNGAVAVFFIIFAFRTSHSHNSSEELRNRCLSVAGVPSLNDRAPECSFSEAFDQSHEQQSPNTDGCGEECFCCCSHIVPGRHFCVDLVELRSLVTTPVNNPLPTSSPDNPFHPPRLS
jgi:hypothetical protein